MSNQNWGKGMPNGEKCFLKKRCSHEKLYKFVINNLNPNLAIDSDTDTDNDFTDNDFIEED